MLNYLWAFMILIGIVWGMANGTAAAVTQGILDSAGEAVSLCVTMLGVISLWTGVLKIAENAGLVGRLTEKMKPLLRFLFPRLPENHPAGRSIATNMIANILGLGWAATPAGLKAMDQLAELEDERRREGSPEARPAGEAGNEMCTFLIINISSLQLIPINMIAYRSRYGSADPTAVIGPALAATLASTAAAVVFCRLMERKGRGAG